MIRLIFLSIVFILFSAPITANATGTPPPVGPPASGEITPDGKCIDRTEQAAELNADPNLRNEICSLALAELSGPKPRDNEFADPELEKCYVMWFESVLNRTAALKERFGQWTVKKTISRESGYWPKKQIRPAVSANNAIGCQRALTKATQGSNTCGYCTDNGSAGVRQASIDRGDEGRDCIAANGKPERFAINKASGYDKWAAREKAKTPPGCNPANAVQPVPPGGGSTPDGKQTTPVGTVPPITNPADLHFNLLSDTLKDIWVASFQLMTSQLTTTMMLQVEAIGTFFDAKHHLETQRLIQQKTAKAHKDYQPSEQMCEMGTFVRNLADSEQRSKLTQTAITRAALDRALAAGDVKTHQIGSDEVTRRENFIKTFCNKKDNAEQNKILCNKETKAERKNADINYTQTVDMPLTLKINLVGDVPETEEEKIEKENIFTFIDYIFMHDRFVWKSKNDTPLHSFVKPYMDMRSIIAMRSVAQNSFAYIISEKAQGPKEKPGAAAKDKKSVAPFLRALMKEMGLKETEINETIGEYPSYYAQMEVLTKTIYQHPEFVANLYDKPANVKRLRAAMMAIKVMQDRDIHKALLRREMLTSLLLELQLRNEQQEFMIQELGPILSSPPQVIKPTTGAGSGTGTGTGP